MLWAFRRKLSLSIVIFAVSFFATPEWSPLRALLSSAHKEEQPPYTPSPTPPAFSISICTNSPRTVTLNGEKLTCIIDSFLLPTSFRVWIHGHVHCVQRAWKCGGNAILLLVHMKERPSPPPFPSLSVIYSTVPWLR